MRKKKNIGRGCFDRFFLFLKRHTEKSNEKKQKSKFKSQNESDTEPKEEE